VFEQMNMDGWMDGWIGVETTQALAIKSFQLSL